MNWYKTAERKSLEQLLQSIESNPGVDRSTLTWLKTLADTELGPAINMLTKNPRASIGEMQRLFTKVVPLTEEQERLVRTYPLIGEWMRGIMERLSGKKREMAFFTLRDKAAGIRDWIDRTGERLQGRTLENAVSETEKWHSESQALERGEYSPSKPENILIQYGDGYSWQRISSGTDAKIEGQNMNHCVGNYCNDVDEGKIDLYSLRDKNNSPLVTAGFKHKGTVVVQMKGEANKNPSETYKGYISDILKKLGTVYNDGEDYLNNNYNLKNFADLDADDIEKSTLLQKIINNQIAREGNVPGFALPWARMKLESGAAPKAWEEAISASIMASGFPPDFAHDWAIRILESGRAPEAWELEISNFILQKGIPPAWAQEWSKKALDSGATPEDWEEAITSYLVENLSIPFWAQEWARTKLHSGRAPKAWEEAITRIIVKAGHPPNWAYDWVKRVLESGTVPKEWEEEISSHIAKTKYPPAWARDWVKKQ